MSRTNAVTIVIMLVVLFGTFALWWQLDVRRDNPAVQRAESKAILAGYAAALKAFREERGYWPADIVELWDWPRFTEVSGLARLDKVSRSKRCAQAEGAGVRFYYRMPEAKDPDDLAVMASPEPLAGVAKGEPFGDAGQMTERDVPSVYYIVTRETEVEELDVEAWTARASWASARAKGRER